MGDPGFASSLSSPLSLLCLCQGLALVLTSEADLADIARSPPRLIQRSRGPSTQAPGCQAAVRLPTGRGGP